MQSYAVTIKMTFIISVFPYCHPRIFLFMQCEKGNKIAARGEPKASWEEVCHTKLTYLVILFGTNCADKCFVLTWNKVALFW